MQKLKTDCFFETERSTATVFAFPDMHHNCVRVMSNNTSLRTLQIANFSKQPHENFRFPYAVLLYVVIPILLPIEVEHNISYEKSISYIL